MNRKSQIDESYLEMARVWSNLSYCSRKKVGAIIVKEGMIISDGFNGTPSKTKPNICEDENGNTHWWVLHGEANAILKCAKNGQSCDGSTIYQTISPCKECAKLIIQSGIRRVVYLDEYKDLDGIHILRESGILVEKIAYS